MLDRLTGKPIHLYLFVLSCALIALGLPLNKVLMSLGTMLGFLNLLLEANFKQYWKNLRQNKAAWGLWAFILIEWLSILWTQNTAYALHDIKVKLPLYAIPLFLVARPISDKRIYYAIACIFLFSLLLTSVINVGSYRHWWGNRSYDDIRGMSLFTSHIRYSLMVVMGVVISIFWIIKKLPFRWVAYGLVTWFIGYTWLSQVLSGYLALGAVLFVLLLFAVRKIGSRIVRLVFVIGSTTIVLVAGIQTWRFLQPVPHKVIMHGLPEYSANGSWYWHDTIDPLWENGYPIIAFISEEELAPVWNRVSSIDYRTGKDKKNQPVRITLWRYMASLGLTKDSTGFKKISRTDVENVENGIASIRLAGTGVKARLYGIQHQLEHSEDPNGHSLLQRFEYWKAARSIIGQNPVLGVGAGDIQDAFNDYYSRHQTRLREDLWHRAHNQYMTSWISSGIFGFMAFLAWWILTLRFGWQHRNFLMLAFAAIAMSSFSIEDTIETQAGVTFVAFFFGLLVSARSHDRLNEAA